ncbi:DUF2635 domain-containing protein [Sulfuriflexus mobilis]|uniref:DUF2635 domain-containing protein n=1 Tax=Sulfuriflexus mobilis TaxID=1811807 RepID=UPI0018D533AB|nr:DUF2635 domain-containing protein [Sulfuriflexus mobilis]
MSKIIHIKPAVNEQTDKKGQQLQVRMPDKPGTFMPSYGAEVPYNSHWLRRIKDKSVVEITADEFIKGKAAAKKKAAAEAKTQTAQTN